MRQMKDSGIEWIGEIPVDWNIKRVKAVLCERNESNNPIQTDEILSLTNDRGVIPYEEKGDVGNKSKEDLTGYKLAYPGDIVLNSMNVFIGSVALSSYFGCVSPVYYMLYPRNKSDSVRFFNYLFQTRELQTKLHGYGNGIMEIRMRIQMSKLNSVQLPVPPSDVQQDIADYLDRKCSQIDTIIARQKEVIEKLKAYKLSVITEAVTKGLNPDVPMKDSGVEWIGEIPTHWILNKFKYLSLAIGDGIHTTPTYDADGRVYFVNGNNIGDEYLVFKEDTNTINDTEYASYKLPLLTENTVFITLNGATYGKTSFYHSEKILLGKSAGFITLKQTESKEFIRYYLQSYTAKLIMDLSLLGSTIANLSLRTLRDFLIPYPPIEEQLKIVHCLNKRISSIDASISKKQKIVDELTDYKKSLIYEVVTGKKEV